MPMWNKLFFQDSNSPLMEHLTFFHDHTMIILFLVTTSTLLILTSSIFNKNINRFFLESQEMELFWTSLPALMLIFIAIPSLKTLYLMEENMNPLITIKTIGYQWYWTYNYANFKNLAINSSINMNMMTRLLNTSANLTIPNFTPTRMLISSKDVIHSWTLPSAGIKVDAMPGRINQTFLMMKRPGIMMGQCSEICGAGHSFMPIIIEIPTPKLFMKNL